MDIQENIVNKVAASGLLTLNLERYYDHGERVVYDIKDNLFHGLMLREKDFREFVKTNDWSAFSGKNVAVTCSADAIVPTWAYMLLTIKLQPYANAVVFGGLEVLETVLFTQAIQKIDLEAFRDQRVVIKGCGDLDVPVSAYVEITRILTPVVKSIMYGEPCSTVPLYKRKD
ncbi:DUF2480 family protein [Pedobacter sp. AW31-3R]|uniref:DUF2480 family protein n=1 Tax=Pedobacter sp. AW31-3R TaxID=3445781 RepID=UPI003FA06AC6